MINPDLVRYATFLMGRIIHNVLGSLTQLMYNNQPLITCTLLGCHIDIESGKPIPVCDARRKSIKLEMGSKDEDEKRKLLKFRDDLRYGMDRIRNVSDGNVRSLAEIKLQILYIRISIGIIM